MCILNQAHLCEDGECALDEVDALINQLEDQVSLTNKRLKSLTSLLEELGVKNEADVDERDVDAMREMITSIAKLFGAK
eukprot:3887011-Ditylum_brightwellii.AAC.1